MSNRKRPHAKLPLQDLTRVAIAATCLVAFVSCCPASRVAAPVPAPPKVVKPVAAEDSATARLSLHRPVATGMTVAGVTAMCDDNLALARDLLAEVRAVEVTAATLKWDDVMGKLDATFLSIANASEFPYLMGVTHPQAAVRTAARSCEKKTDELVTGIYLDAKLAAVVNAYAERPDVPPTAERLRFVQHTRRDFKRNGTNLDPKAQARLRELNQKLTGLGQEFTAAISSSKGSIKLKPSQLKGLPKDYIESHKANDAGVVTVTTDYPDYYPFVTYAADREAARQLYVLFVNRGGDANVARLQEILSLRDEKAKLLGYPSWAAYAIEPRMAKTPEAVDSFLKRVSGAISGAAKAEYAEFQAEFAQVFPSRKRLLPPDRYFLTDRLKAKKFKLDSKELAQYFDVRDVTAGLLAITSEMYGIEYRPVEGSAWHPTVVGYEVIDHGQPIARFYLDLQPRADKYKHAAMFTVRTGYRLPNGTYQTPIAALACNFPPPGQPMPHSQVVTFFHEFGHVLHHVLSKTELASFYGTNTARDFVEAPSQMFEEWAWSKKVLDRFAKHRTTGKPMPNKLVESMGAARRVGLALATERQLFLAALDQRYHRGKPAGSTTAMLEQVHGEYFSFGYVKGTHFQSSFGHLIHYDAGYYGYQWALALAMDVLGEFKSGGLMNTATASKWRREVLSKGGSVDEAEQVTRFLGRPSSEKAYADFLAGN